MEIDNKRRHSEDEPKQEAAKKVKSQEPKYAYLETVVREKLDFDSEKICCITLSPLNVYCCLVCGRFYQGRHEKSPAFIHSINENHHVFLNLTTLKFYILPQNIQILHDDKVQLLNGIKYALYPTYRVKDLQNFPRQCFDLSNRVYLNGFIGFTNTAVYDYAHSVLLIISHMIPLRDHFLLNDFDDQDEFIKRLSICIKKIWSPKLFKHYLSVDDFVTYLKVKEGLSLSVVNPRFLLLWLLNKICSSSKQLKSILNQYCKGKVRIIGNKRETEGSGTVTSKVNVKPFWVLTLDLPEFSPFKDGNTVDNLPQVNITQLLTKFTNVRTSSVDTVFEIVQLPQFLIFHFNRFDRSSEHPVKNRNQTIVEFSSELEVLHAKYRLKANVVHMVIKSSSTDSNDSNRNEKSHWVTQLYNDKIKKWIEIDGINTTEKEAELLFLNETFIQVWEKQE
ncbi:sad1p [Saccharomyces arboricola H-6]|uniref:Sad1p n=1 Tax=Saccharomyces arboricola (strain H-6 / AS 2.3317 / CBS 10644) TaxID=1160507 RepID=J8Q2L3_SACAR|nr:sad1p [Saccharomyces arboricola H-6]